MACRQVVACEAIVGECPVVVRSVVRGVQHDRSAVVSHRRLKAPLSSAGTGSQCISCMPGECCRVANMPCMQPCSGMDMSGTCFRCENPLL